MYSLRSCFTSLASVVLLALFCCGTAFGNDLTKREYAAARAQKGVVFLGVNWGRAWNYCGFENVQLQRLSFDRMPIARAPDSPPDLALRGAKLTAKPVSVDHALLLEPGEYALTAYHIKAAKSVNDVGAFQAGRAELIEDGNPVAGSFTVAANEIVYIGHFAPDCPEQGHPVVWRYYLKDAAAFKEYLAKMKTSFPFLDVASTQFRLFKTTSIGNDFELTEETQ